MDLKTEGNIAVKKEKKDRKAYMNKYMKEYRKKNKDKFSARSKCEICGTYYDKVNKFNHFNTKKHELNDLRQKIESMKKII